MINRFIEDKHSYIEAFVIAFTVGTILQYIFT